MVPVFIQITDSPRSRNPPIIAIREMKTVLPASVCSLYVLLKLMKTLPITQMEQHNYYLNIIRPPPGHRWPHVRGSRLYKVAGCVCVPNRY